MALITLTSDFGTADGYAAAMKGVLVTRAPAARLLDLSHDLPPHDVRAGAWLLLRAVPFFPPGTIHLAVVDPGVGGARRPIALETGGQFLIGPDNGLFSLLPARIGAGRWRAVAIDRGRVDALPGTSAVFEGRDVFAPAAAALANALASAEREGAVQPSAVDLTALGERIEDWERFTWAEPRREGGSWFGEVLHVDRFGNAVTSLTPRLGGGPLQVRGRLVRRGRTYADVAEGELVAVEGSSGFLEVAANRASAAIALGIAPGDVVTMWIEEARAG